MSIAVPLSGFGSKNFKTELLWANGKPGSSFGSQAVVLSKELSDDDWVIICFKAADNSEAVANIMVKNGQQGRVTSSATSSHGFRNATVSSDNVTFTGAIWGGNSDSKYLVPTHIYKLGR